MAVGVQKHRLFHISSGYSKFVPVNLLHIHDLKIIFYTFFIRVVSLTTGKMVLCLPSMERNEKDYDKGLFCPPEREITPVYHLNLESK